MLSMPKLASQGLLNRCPIPFEPRLRREEDGAPVSRFLREAHRFGTALPFLLSVGLTGLLGCQEGASQGDGDPPDALLAVAASSAWGNGDAPTDSLADAESWAIQVIASSPRWVPDSAGCLFPSSTVFAPGQVIEALATDGQYFLIDEDGGCLRAEDVIELSRPSPAPEPARLGEVVYPSTRYSYGEDGCPVAGEALPEYTEVAAIARSYDFNYHGYVVIDQDLTLAPVRHVNADGWVYPWHSSLQLVKQVTGGFVIGGGVLIAPDVLLTARHMGVDETWCYSREPFTGEAWYGGMAVCGNIVGPAEEHPDGVDAALVYLISPEDPPYAEVRSTPLKVGEAFFSSKWSSLYQNAFADSTIEKVGSDNAFCLRWPKNTSFISADDILSGGDSGGPAWIGDELVGLVHGEKCYMGLERVVWQQSGQPPAQVLVDVPGIYSFLAPELRRE